MSSSISFISNLFACLKFSLCYPILTQNYFLNKCSPSLCEISSIFNFLRETPIVESFCCVFIFSFTDFSWYRQHYSTDPKVSMFWSIWCHNNCSYFKNLHIEACCFFSWMTWSKCFPNVVFPYLNNSSLLHGTSIELILTL